MDVPVFDSTSDYDGGWMQYYCNGDVLHSGPQSGPANGSATGMMQVIASLHVGATIGGFNPVVEGSVCSGDGIKGDQLYNLAVGTAIYGLCVSDSESILLQHGATADQIEKDAIAKYKYGKTGGKYWDRSALPNFVKLDNTGGVEYADSVLAIKSAAPWNSNLDCPCD